MLASEDDSNILRLRPKFNNQEYNRFYKWLVGFTDGNGSFIINCSSERKIQLCFSINQSIYNLRILYYIKSKLKVGSVTKHNKLGQYRIWNLNHLENIILPIFNKYSLLTIKYFNYEQFKKAYYINKNFKLTLKEKYDLIKQLKEIEPLKEYKSPNTFNLDKKSIEELKLILTKEWIIGFVEAKGSFFIKIDNKFKKVKIYFSISQKLDDHLLQAIAKIFHFPSKVQYNKYGFYFIQTSNSRVINKIKQYFQGEMKGMKSLEIKLWSKAIYYKDNYKKLFKIKTILRKLRSNKSIKHPRVFIKPKEEPIKVIP